jgi:hypothetical protein
MSTSNFCSQVAIAARQHILDRFLTVFSTFYDTPGLTRLRLSTIVLFAIGSFIIIIYSAIQCATGDVFYYNLLVEEALQPPSILILQRRTTRTRSNYRFNSYPFPVNGTRNIQERDIKQYAPRELSWGNKVVDSTNTWTSSNNYSIHAYIVQPPKAWKHGKDISQAEFNHWLFMPEICFYDNNYHTTDTQCAKGSLSALEFEFTTPDITNVTAAVSGASPGTAPTLHFFKEWKDLDSKEKLDIKMISPRDKIPLAWGTMTTIFFQRSYVTSVYGKKETILRLEAHYQLIKDKASARVRLIPKNPQSQKDPPSPGIIYETINEQQVYDYEYIQIFQNFNSSLKLWISLYSILWGTLKLNPWGIIQMWFMRNKILDRMDPRLAEIDRSWKERARRVTPLKTSLDSHDFSQDPRQDYIHETALTKSSESSFSHTFGTSVMTRRSAWTDKFYNKERKYLVDTSQYSGMIASTPVQMPPPLRSRYADVLLPPTPLPHTSYNLYPSIQRYTRSGNITAANSIVAAALAVLAARYDKLVEFQKEMERFCEEQQDYWEEQDKFRQDLDSFRMRMEIFYLNTHFFREWGESARKASA